MMTASHTCSWTALEVSVSVWGSLQRAPGL